jgi:D-beta-D-heptose 7-phosphate kinase/D-beta-D-heptose 1-phosphate adenosyltransferase
MICYLSDQPGMEAFWRYLDARWPDAMKRRLVLTNGCFDLLHAGHIDLLQKARGMGDLLVVGLNSDKSVRRVKGPGRPLVGEEDRAIMLSELRCVDAVVIYDQLTPRTLVKAIHPTVLVKGADYAKGTVIGRREIESWGGRVELVETDCPLRTSEIVARVKAVKDMGYKRRGFAQ